MNAVSAGRYTELVLLTFGESKMSGEGDFGGGLAYDFGSTSIFCICCSRDENVKFSLERSNCALCI